MSLFMLLVAIRLYENGLYGKCEEQREKGGEWRFGKSRNVTGEEEARERERREC